MIQQRMMGWWPTCKIFAIVSLQKEGGAAVCCMACLACLFKGYSTYLCIVLVNNRHLDVLPFESKSLIQQFCICTFVHLYIQTNIAKINHHLQWKALVYSTPNEMGKFMLCINFYF